MDGNGRWAKARHLPRVAGHKSGMESVRSVVKMAPDLGIEVLTLYAFSSENWKRPEEEVGFLFNLLKSYLQSEIAELDAKNVQIRCIGNWRALPADLVTLIDGAIERTKDNAGLKLVLALNYGSHDEITRAVRACVADGLTGGQIDEAAIEARLDTAGLPAPDLIIRTSGEERLSNFMMWQAAYSEFVFTPVLWPDFDGDALARACDHFAVRERRYGGI
ncbi:di-trans,poly-cis-decaprenylcistransferase [Pacificimonas sp. WHA3]|uniref:Isoprenyl transferase n=1 Tax=Pacificimonas pallii TaxID=2827236 RepID=A0ABS6SF71_9SPHN|nr:polyprenyl diphosphate synthase [Pacificimonas pallii]MBV7256576.1 di-trans,poly-cis-decaprenylcistransferase [Pacificimonas pallii]